jgi:hypothetical protein
MPINTSRPTSGSAKRPLTRRVQATSALGQYRRTYGSSPRYAAPKSTPKKHENATPVKKRYNSRAGSGECAGVSTHTINSTPNPSAAMRKAPRRSVRWARTFLTASVIISASSDTWTRPAAADTPTVTALLTRRVPPVDHGPSTTNHTGAPPNAAASMWTRPPGRSCAGPSHAKMLSA